MKLCKPLTGFQQSTSYEDVENEYDIILNKVTTSVAISEVVASTDGESLSCVDTEEIGNFHPSEAASSGPEEE